MAGRVTAALEVGVGDYSIEGASDPDKGSLKPLCLFLRGQVVEGVVC